MPNITNAQVDAVVGAIGAPYGPLTRVTNVEALAQPNDQFQFEFTDNNGNTVYAHWHEINDAERVVELLNEANGYNAIMHGALAELNSIVTDFPEDAVNGTYTRSDFIAFVNRLRELDIVRNYL